MRRLLLSLGLLTIVAVGSAGCSVTHYRQAARPVSATLEIQVDGQWTQVSRMTYKYSDVPTAELERLLRDREARGLFDAETSALRILIEARKLGMGE